VQIASYRDPQLGATLRDLITKAADPQRLHFGICLQLDPSDQQSCGQPSLPQGEALQGSQLTLDQVAASASQGVCWARARTQRLWQHEPFTLQIDSHMRCVAGWDNALLACWQRCGDRRAVLSVYPNAFELPDHCDTAMLPLMGAHRFDEHGVLRLQGINRFRNPEELPASPLTSAFVAAGLLFGPGELIREVPYDPELYFYGEEITLALRLWTRGFNLYNPDRLLIFHLYKTSGNGSPTHWADHSNWNDHNERSLARVKALTHGHHVEAPFGLGTVRTLQEWQQWSGINLQEQTISDDALAGQFGPPPPSPD
jgi:hypothetical protein